MNIASITFKYDAQKNVVGYIVYVDGKIGDVEAFNGQVTLGKDELNLAFIMNLVQKKIGEIFTKEQLE
ncbi:hypothetical protein [Enterococcus casseliflavus]|uniref:hypothetical protein n=1 Tax=Enterococcus casseliflavus TaxID=37734 RepID=UPI002890AE40|nr:hypothetical protein [Enterococcus casseliflavus]MDT2973437.1 hypothetical protein [Enterococcus casseliflavus]